MLLKAEALLFDLDGTIADTAQANYLSYGQALAEVGVNIQRREFDQRAFGRNWRDFLPEMLSGAETPVDPAHVAHRKREVYPAHIPAVRINTALTTLASTMRGSVRTGLVTTASALSVQAILSAHGLADLFDTVVSGDDVDRHKPDPTAYLLAARRLGVDPASCIAFEDSDIGCASATAAGMRVVRVSFIADEHPVELQPSASAER